MKEKKERAKEYEKKLKIDGTFADVLKVSVPKDEKEKTLWYWLSSDNNLNS